MRRENDSVSKSSDEAMSTRHKNDILVYKPQAQAEHWKETVTRSANITILIRKLENNEKGPSSKGSIQKSRLINLSNQFKNFHIDGGKMRKDNKNNKSQDHLICICVAWSLMELFSYSQLVRCKVVNQD